jgi:voltage-gated sodium channel
MSAPSHNDSPRSLQSKVQKFVESPRFVKFILSLIVLTAIILGLETSKDMMAKWGTTLEFINNIFLAVFVVELILRIYAWRGRFFKDGWSLFDLIVIGISLIPASGPLAILRALRVLRVLRVVSAVPAMRRVVTTLLGALPGLGSIAILLSLVYYVFAVIATRLFGEAFPDWFGSLPNSLYTLFQVMTLESWSMGISRPVMEAFPYAWMFFIPFILIATFTMLNLFIAIIVNAMQSFNDAEHAEEKKAEARAHSDEVTLLYEKLDHLQADMQFIKAQLAKTHTPPIIK